MSLHRVDRTPDASLWAPHRCVPAPQATEELLQAADQSASLMTSAAGSWRAPSRSVLTPAMELVDSMLIAQLEIIFLCASVHLDMKETHLDNATRFLKSSPTLRLLILVSQVHVDQIQIATQLTEEHPASV